MIVVMIPNQIECDGMEITVLSDRTDYYIDAYGRVRPVEKGCFLEDFYRQQIKYYTRKLRECEENVCRNNYWR